jgi:hypothetical protein
MLIYLFELLSEVLSANCRSSPALVSDLDNFFDLHLNITMRLHEIDGTCMKLQQSWG